MAELTTLSKWPHHTLADIPPETREQAFRRGYRSGYMAAVNDADRLRFLRSWARIYNALLDHWQLVLPQWANEKRRPLGFAFAPRPKEMSCVYCGGQASQLDHVVPKSRGGSDEDVNLMPCCPSCNQGKGARTLEEWGQ